jgi:hypothetical protein
MFIQRSPWPQSHTPEDVRFSALTAAPAGGKLTLPRFGEALTLRVSPRGFLKRQRGATFGPPLPLYDHGLLELLQAHDRRLLC